MVPRYGQTKAESELYSVFFPTGCQLIPQHFIK